MIFRSFQPILVTHGVRIDLGTEVLELALGPELLVETLCPRLVLVVVTDHFAKFYYYLFNSSLGVLGFWGFGVFKLKYVIREPPATL